ncbi:hypothetical protein C8R47DRAFT_1243001, partial [Mycena vitilis]
SQHHYSRRTRPAARPPVRAPEQVPWHSQPSTRAQHMTTSTTTRSITATTITAVEPVEEAPDKARTVRIPAAIPPQSLARTRRQLIGFNFSLERLSAPMQHIILLEGASPRGPAGTQAVDGTTLWSPARLEHTSKSATNGHRLRLRLRLHRHRRIVCVCLRASVPRNPLPLGAYTRIIREKGEFHYWKASKEFFPESLKDDSGKPETS